MEPVDVARLFELEKKLRARRPRGLRWLDDEHFLLHERPEDGADDAPRQLHRVVAATGEATPLYDASQMEEALGRQKNVGAKSAKKLARRGAYTFLPGHDGVVLNHKGRLFRYDFGQAEAVRLAPGGKGVGERLSPDGKLIGFVRKGDLHAASSGGGRGRALTQDGGSQILNGRLDWVYQEEVYGRGNWNGFWWAPDSGRVLFLRLDEKPVDAYPLPKHTAVRGKSETWRYPKAGDPNPLVQVGLVRPDGQGGVVWADLSAYPEDDRLVVNAGWTPDSAEAVIQVTNRVQSHLDLLFVNPDTGAVRRLFREEPGPWVRRSGVHWIDDDRFLWESTRDGFKHLYVVHRESGVERQLTSGEFEIEGVRGVDKGGAEGGAEGAAVYALTDEGNPREKHLWRIPLDGSERTRVTTRRGQHTANLSPGFVRAVVQWQNAEDPGGAELVSLPDGAAVRGLAAADTAPLAEAGYIAPEFFQIDNGHGFAMEASVVKPPDFREDGRYPILVHVYGGPHAPIVRDQWTGFRSLFNSELARRGILVLAVDPQSASGKSERSAWTMFRRAGETELRDIETAIDNLVERGWADPERVGITGWSYGGFMASYSLTHSKRFKVGIAGASVTDWRNYDSIYTERYMGTPQDNADGYESSSVVKAAGDLHGKLLLVHGTMDENVHLSNTLQLVHALQKAGKDFDLMLYPENRHGVSQKQQREHLHRLMSRFILENL